MAIFSELKVRPSSEAFSMAISAASEALLAPYRLDFRPGISVATWRQSKALFQLLLAKESPLLDVLMITAVSIKAGHVP